MRVALKAIVFVAWRTFSFHSHLMRKVNCYEKKRRISNRWKGRWHEQIQSKHNLYEAQLKLLDKKFENTCNSCLPKHSEGEFASTPWMQKQHEVILGKNEKRKKDISYFAWVINLVSSFCKISWYFLDEMLIPYFCNTSIPLRLNPRRRSIKVNSHTSIWTDLGYIWLKMRMM